ncbi:hypothetical protein AVEN_128172-1 [Araneus ventricosus]|uniref:Uncharacterized protein n=1 Tax=Araneus ventricosus TaxID=182803 RepID=A0A4Y1ZZS7_ARAVE|nr:hypothetical protein AVEN_128172-1 [Araneus ventricosus]
MVKRDDEIRTCYLSHPGHRIGDYPEEDEGAQGLRCETVAFRDQADTDAGMLVAPAAIWRLTLQRPYLLIDWLECRAVGCRSIGH